MFPSIFRTPHFPNNRNLPSSGHDSLQIPNRTFENARPQENVSDHHLARIRATWICLGQVQEEAPYVMVPHSSRAR